MIPENLLYTKDHEWASIEGDIATIGITDHAQEALGDITFLDLPKKGRSLEPHDLLGSVESSKAASDIYSPVAGTVVEVNSELSSQPELVNKDCYGQGWIAKLRLSDPSATKNLLSPAQYKEYLLNL